MSTKPSKVIDLKATPEDEDFGHKYTDEGSGKIGSSLINGYFRAVQRLIDDSKVAGRKKAKAIEIGCGEGYSTQRLRAMLASAIELQASEYVGHQIPMAQKLNPAVKITEESAYDTKHKDGTFDLVFLLEVLEHLDYPDKALAELRRIVKKDGYLILGVPHEPLWCMLNMARGKYLSHFGNTPGHLNHWTTRGLVRTVEKHFGKVIVVKTPLPWTIVLAQPR